MRPSRLFLATAAFASACNATGPGTAQLSGKWTYSATDIQSADGRTFCKIEGLTMVVTQSSNTFTGTAGTGSLSCQVAQVPAAAVVHPGTVIANGVISGEKLSFDLRTPASVASGTPSRPDSHHDGKWAPPGGFFQTYWVMSGDVTVRADFGGAPVELKGFFWATKD